MARGYIFTDLARERRLVDHEIHGKRRLFNVNHFHRLWALRVTDGLSDGDICNAGDDNDIAAFCLLDRHALESSVDKDLIDLTLHDAAVCFCNCHSLSFLDNAFGDTTDTESADVVVIGECRNLQLQRFLVQIRIRLAMLDDGIKERRQIQTAKALRALFDLVVALADQHIRDLLRVFHRHALPRDPVKDREIQLFIACIQIHKQLIDLVNDLVDAGVLFIQLVDEQNRVDALLQRFFEYEARLRHRSLAGIHQQNDRIDGFHNALYLRTEIRVARRIDNVDLDVVVHDRTVLGINGDASFSFDVIAVHDAVHDLFIRPEHAALVEERIHKRGFARVNVCNDGNIDDFFFLTHVYPSFYMQKERNLVPQFFHSCAKFVEILTIARKTNI